MLVSWFAKFTESNNVTNVLQWSSWTVLNVLSLTTQYVIINCDIGEYWNLDFHVLLCVYAWMKEWDIDMFHHVLLTQPKS